MSEQRQLSKKDELITILQQSIEQIQSVPEGEIQKRRTKLNTENGTGFYISNDQIHIWLVKLNQKI